MADRVPHPAVAAADKAWADQNHEQLCDCATWPDACVNGYVPGTWLTGATDVAVVAALRWAADRYERTGEQVSYPGTHAGSLLRGWADEIEAQYSTEGEPT